MKIFDGFRLEGCDDIVDLIDTSFVLVKKIEISGGRFLVTRFKV